MKPMVLFLYMICTVLLCTAAAARPIIDASGRTVQVPEHVERVICSGPGCLRLLTYLRSQQMAVAVDSAELSCNTFDARPYAIANPQFKKLPLFGEFRGNDNPELILSLTPQPQVIFKTYAGMGHDPAELQKKTGIPVVVLDYGNLTDARFRFFASLDIMAGVIGKKEQSDAVKAFLGNQIADLTTRCGHISAEQAPSVFIGGVAYKGQHGFQSTEPAYPPFVFINAWNPANDKTAATTGLRVSNIAKEKILEWDPDFLFLDLSSLQSEARALNELKNDPVYKVLTAVRSGRVYGVLPYNSYTINYGSALANAYYIGKTLYPDRFEDIDPAEKADAIYTFLVGEPVFSGMNQCVGNHAFNSMSLR
ncbi:iron ABC transporter substrate-binding protein [Pontiella sulfatireligans]|uniref:Fe/B12 periplasmic-binding domain-containing protein n=1 Tax=Pontiella sulfatireligans TaxID=2750658 RepID=A0A6C2UIA0_9BACT|nr:iron ABC transporter substrate-binding protein [Pontiella sulfatireligans]VGO19942.1 hypothetical protein SCARR_02002 [Pontiella sulfatireligans]